MFIQQFEDKGLAHFSYAILSQGEIALIDPARDPQPYYDFAAQHNAKITAVVETHPHADFVSSHLEISRTTGAKVFASQLLEAEYPHQTFDEGDTLLLGAVTLQALNTPGHSPDSISILLLDKAGKSHAVFTGDTLFIGDCGRPDLREQAGAIRQAREELARLMYYSLRIKLMTLPDEVLVYPAHGAGSLCGKGLSAENASSIGAEKIGNWSLQEMSEAEFIRQLLADQPFIPKYFPHDVVTNKKGAECLAKSISAVPRGPAIHSAEEAKSINQDIMIIDTRPEQQFKEGHLRNSINLMNGPKFETWLGSIISPNEPFYLATADEFTLNELIARTARIGYESQIVSAFVLSYGGVKSEAFDISALRKNEDEYTILDIRNDSEVKDSSQFKSALHIPLHELRERINEVPTNKPIVVHCAGGYRSAAGSSILERELEAPVYDLGEAIKNFSHAVHRQK